MTQMGKTINMFQLQHRCGVYIIDLPIIPCTCLINVFGNFEQKPMIERMDALSFRALVTTGVG